MTLLLAILLCAAPEAADETPPPAAPAVGQLLFPEDDMQAATEYVPQEGDLVFTSRFAPLRTAFYWAFRTGHPLHCGVVVRSHDGNLVLFEVGGGDAKTTTWLPIEQRFAEDMTTRRSPQIWIRSITQPLNADESSRLTAFASSELGKPLQSPYKYLRLAIPGRPARASRNDQPEWFCSELVVHGLAEAGVWRSELPAGSIVPANLFYDRYVDLSPRWSPPRQWSPGQSLPLRQAKSPTPAKSKR